MGAAQKWAVRVLFAGFVIFLISAFPVADALADAFARITWKRPDGPPSITVCLSENLPPIEYFKYEQHTGTRLTSESLFSNQDQRRSVSTPAGYLGKCGANIFIRTATQNDNFYEIEMEISKFNNWEYHEYQIEEPSPGIFTWTFKNSYHPEVILNNPIWENDGLEVRKISSPNGSNP